jgi:hypothetical protein
MRLLRPRVATKSGAQTHSLCLGLARTIYIRFIYGFFGREITKYTAIYGVYIRFWPTLPVLFERHEVGRQKDVKNRQARLRGR